MVLCELERRAALVVPSPQQLAWQEMECIAFAHFGPTTFTGRGCDGSTPPEAFNPTALDARQWARVCKDAGLKMIILTAKHHDGFCLWPSRYTEYSVRHSPWQGGEGDVVREVAEACRDAGLKFGLYLSPWDCHEPTYGDSPAYNAFYKNQLHELLTQYGEVTEVWLDGYCGEGPNGKRQVYDWAGYYALIRRLQPQALIAICGPDVAWCGNEQGFAGETQWSVAGFNADPYREPPDWEALHGEFARRSKLVEDGAEDEGPGSLAHLAGARHLAWYPAECDVSIRPHWFYNAREDDQVKSIDVLLDIYDRSVGHNAVLLLNLPPDQRGLIHENDARRARELRAALDERFAHDLALGKPVAAGNTHGHDRAYAPAHVTDGDPATFWMAGEGETSAWLEVDLGRPTALNCALLQEQIALGQRVERFSLGVWDGSAWRACAHGTTIGHKRLLRFPEVTAQRMRLAIHGSRLCPTLQALGLYRIL